MLLAYDTRVGTQAAAIAICGDADDMFIDHQRQRLYVVCGEGLVQVIQRQADDRYEVAERLATSPGARTGLFVPELSTLFVAVPAREGRLQRYEPIGTQ